MNEVVQLYLAPVLLLVGWFLLRHRQPARALILGLWLFLTVIAGVFGSLGWKPTNECTKLASILIIASGTFLAGPFLIISAGRKWHWAWSLAATAVLPLPSAWACAIVLLYSGQVWGV